MLNKILLFGGRLHLLQIKEGSLFFNCLAQSLLSFIAVVFVLVKVVFVSVENTIQ
jgi:hypothetical protein